ncbi:MAG: HupE/UreJ family protein [Myxococcota bacterium]|nr:HupE/UreJ family protein [Myxococcota bacterium]
MKVVVAALALALASLVASPAWAHKPSDSYLTLDVDGPTIDGRWDIAVRDLEYALHVDDSGDGAVTWGEILAHGPDIRAYAVGRLSLRADGAACAATADDLRVAEHSDGAYVVLRLRATCPTSPRALEVVYSLLFDVDPQHRGLLQLGTPAEGRTAIFSAGAPVQRFDLTRGGRTSSFLAAVREGIRHILSGIDHLLFLLALLLPSVLRLEGGSWRPVARFRPALRDVLQIVTAFTIAHSITLSLAALDVVRLPSRVVESAIALSVVMAAVNNVYPILRGERWFAAFALGLLHGFGFSATLVDLGLPRGQLVRILFGFNVGVEIGQFAVVATFLPLAYALRRTAIYRRAGLLGGSVAIAAVAAVWVIERAFDVKPFS